MVAEETEANAIVEAKLTECSGEDCIRKVERAEVANE